jgi:hypothetical protein
VTFAHIEIGSDFELVDDSCLTAARSARLPWESSADITYVESGRQALAVAEAELRRQGHTQLSVPSYLCDSMVEAFHPSGWHVTQLPVDSDLVVQPADLLARVTEGVLLHAPYFGRQDSPDMEAALEVIRHRGVVVVVDESHRTLTGPSPVADIRVASLGKLLPLYDGGYVTGVRWPVQAEGPSHATLPDPPSEIATLRRLAMQAKSEALHSGESHGDGGDEDKAHLKLFARAADATARQTQPRRTSADSLALMGRLDLEVFRARREMNSATLLRALGHSDRFRVINPPAENLLPSHLVLETDDMSGLRRHLTGQRIYCPVHWPPSQLLPRTSAWPNRYLSLPVDQRYGEVEMLRMAGCVRAYFGESRKGSAA